MILLRAKDEQAKALQRVSHLESDLTYTRRQFDDEYDRLDRELRRYHADMAEISLENRRLKASLGHARRDYPVEEGLIY